MYHFMLHSTLNTLLFLFTALRLADLGFDPQVNYQKETTGNVQLLVRLLVPACLLIAVMLQLHIFHEKFLEVTQTNILYVILASTKNFLPAGCSVFHTSLLSYVCHVCMYVCVCLLVLSNFRGRGDRTETRSTTADADTNAAGDHASHQS